MLNIEPGFTHITQDTIKRLGKEKYNKFRKRFKQEFETPDDFDDYGVYEFVDSYEFDDNYEEDSYDAISINRDNLFLWSMFAEYNSRELTYTEIIQFINSSEVTMLPKLQCGDIVYLANGASGFVIQPHDHARPFLRIHDVDYTRWYTVRGLYTDKLEYEPNSEYDIVKVERHVDTGTVDQIYPVVEKSPIEVIDRKIKKLRKKIAKLEEQKNNLL